MKLIQKKESGSAILITMVVGVVMLSLGLTALNLVVSDAKVAQDFIFSERAYFAAESGMERSLLQLKLNPVEHVEAYEIPLNEDLGQVSVIDINNRESEFVFDIPPFKSRKFRLRKETDACSKELYIDETNDDCFKSTDDFKVQVIDRDSSITESMHWKYICSEVFDDDKSRTVSLQDSLPIGQWETEKSMASQIGKWDTFNLITAQGGDRYVAETISDTSVGSFLSRTGLVNTSCFFSLTNNSATATLKVKVSANGTDVMSPYATRITSVGRSGSREKTIEFNYVQKNLGELFDFVFFHIGE